MLSQAYCLRHCLCEQCAGRHQCSHHFIVNKTGGIICMTTSRLPGGPNFLGSVAEDSYQRFNYAKAKRKMRTHWTFYKNFG